MKNYNYEKINSLIQPLIEFLNEEYPNDYVLEIKPNGAELYHKATTLSFLSSDLQKQLDEVRQMANDPEKMKEQQKEAIKALSQFFGLDKNQNEDNGEQL